MRKRERAERVSAVDTEDREFVISRVFRATQRAVFEAWTQPALMARWWGPHHFTNPVCDMDVRPGGAYRIVMRGPDGTDYPVSGVFREVVRHRLVMTVDTSEHPEEWQDLVKPNRRKGENAAGEILQTVTFEEQDGGTKVTIRMQLESAAIRDALVQIGMNEGWSESLERLADLLKKEDPNVRGNK